MNTYNNMSFDDVRFVVALNEASPKQANKYLQKRSKAGKSKVRQQARRNKQTMLKAFEW